MIKMESGLFMMQQIECKSRCLKRTFDSIPGKRIAKWYPRLKLKFRNYYNNDMLIGKWHILVFSKVPETEYPWRNQSRSNWT